MQYNQILMADEGDVISIQIGIGTCVNCGVTIFGGGTANYTATNEWTVRNGELLRAFIPEAKAQSFCNCKDNDRLLVHTGIHPKVVSNAT